MDNASACDALARYLVLLLNERYKINLTVENNRVRCLAHIVNLVVQEILSHMNEVDSPSIVDLFLLSKHLPHHYNVDEDEEVLDMEAEPATEIETETETGTGTAQRGKDVNDELVLPTDLDTSSSLKKVGKTQVYAV